MPSVAWPILLPFKLLPALLYSLSRALFGLASPLADALRNLLLHSCSALVYLIVRPLPDLLFHPSASRRARQDNEGYR